MQFYFFVINLARIFFTFTKIIYSMELVGSIKKISEIQTFSSGFQKREIVLLTEEQYPQPISIEFLQDKVDLLNSLTLGEKVKISINIRGREWTAPDGQVKYFNSITGWRVEKVDNNAASHEPTQAYNTPAATSTVQDTNVFGDEDDDLPF